MIILFYLSPFFTRQVSFTCLKEGARKGHPAVPSTWGGYLALLAVDGTLKTHRLWRFRQVQRLFPSTAMMLSGTERNYNPKMCICYV
jgi:hypothetical protein